MITLTIDTPLLHLPIDQLYIKNDGVSLLNQIYLSPNILHNNEFKNKLQLINEQLKSEATISHSDWKIELPLPNQQFNYNFNKNIITIQTLIYLIYESDGSKLYREIFGYETFEEYLHAEYTINT